MKILSALSFAATALCAVSGRRLGDSSPKPEELQQLPAEQHARHMEYMSMGGEKKGDIMAMLESMGIDLASLNYTDIYDRCCGDDLSECKCPVRTNETFVEKWDMQCDTTLAYKAGVKEAPSSPDAIFAMLEKMGVDLASLNYTDIYDRCCGEDLSECKCPVRQNATFVEKWDMQCETTLAYKAGVAEAPEGFMSYGSDSTTSKPPMGSGMTDGEFLAQFGMTEESFDIVELYETMFKKEFNYTDIADRCCSNNDIEKPSKYMINAADCACPIRQSEMYMGKWDESCKTVIVPGAKKIMAGMR